MIGQAGSLGLALHAGHALPGDQQVGRPPARRILSASWIVGVLGLPGRPTSLPADPREVRLGWRPVRVLSLSALQGLMVAKPWPRRPPW